MTIEKTSRVRDRDFLAWAKRERGICCLCRWLKGETRLADELHHWGEKGTAQKSHDYEIARLCKPHHDAEQGKRRLAYLREGRIEVLEALERDALDLVISYLKER
jgi:hypothetical protein